ncbi:RagB/SusD family nutrient uptake outer membrane protein [Pedobacter gandavensis]|uniref:RagB/SusD family nutrient uptake outer membrane protein n=1 Tax=Pedobacter gandavensis TaxID=2679963 RepID=A0ABR6ERM9_9SPHI|nr:RagB/SusD family nutrient uptake outer membrane protein [Pedobacter gandavensis]MBB2147906.1 RagB/SusD family nutrient uptake outer membrane protein [Pedobacter gandavensis]
MKINIKLMVSLAVAGAVFFSSCKKSVLDTEPFNKISEETVWNNKANAETFIFSTYGIMYDYASGPQTDPYTLNTLGFDDIYNGAAPVFNERLDRNSGGNFNNWSTIRRCNQIITKVGASVGISEADKKALIAEGKFLRAMSYYSVARRTGRIVWIDGVLNPDDDLFLPATANPTASYQLIIKDLEDAVADLPATKVSGRANKYTAASFLTEVCLSALAYKNYPAAASVSASDPLLDKVIANAQIVISGGYALENNYGAMFNSENPLSSETVFGIYRKAANTFLSSTPMQLMVPNMNNDRVRQNQGSPLFAATNTVFEAWVQHGPSQNMADDYLVIDQANPTKALPWNQTSQYLAAVDETAVIPTTAIRKAGGETSIKRGMIRPGSTESIWTLTNKGRDARWAASIISDSTKFYGETITTGLRGNADRWIKIDGVGYYLSLSNLYWKKGVYENISPRYINSTPTDYHFVVSRLGRVYLNMAEAYLLKGDVANAVAMFNKTRVTHGKLPASQAATSAEAWTDYKRERRIDLVLENDYYWSLLRWGRYGGDANYGKPSGDKIPELEQLPTVMDISKDRKSFSIVQGSFFSSNNIRVFDNSRRYLFPITQGLIDQNPKFGPQNPGW